MQTKLINDLWQYILKQFIFFFLYLKKTAPAFILQKKMYQKKNIYIGIFAELMRMVYLLFLVNLILLKPEKTG